LSRISIGPVFAQRLVGAFNEAVFEVIECEPHRLFEVEGISRKRAARITASWADQKAIREIMAFLQSHGVSTSRAVRIYKTYGADAIPVVSENPYCLARDIVGIGFKSADLIASRLGIAKTAMIRAEAGVEYTLMEAVADGHCGLPEEDLLGRAEKLLEIPRQTLVEAVGREVAGGFVVSDEINGRRCVFLAHLWHAERVIGQRLLTLSREPPPWSIIDAERAIAWGEKKLNMTLAASQQAAVRLALSSKVLVITGGPGVGKTTLVNSILTILRAKSVSVALCAPTGRAAKRLAESTGLIAKTIHRLLEADPRRGGFKRGEDNPLACDLLVVDEASMVDVPLMASLVKALAPYRRDNYRDSIPALETLRRRTYPHHAILPILFVHISQDFLLHARVRRDFCLTDESWAPGGSDPYQHRTATPDALGLPGLGTGLDKYRFVISAHCEPYGRCLALITVLADGRDVDQFGARERLRIMRGHLGAR
jgi:exodeoxyribonuclease V alpha subunit